VKAWQHGFPLDELRPITQSFRRAEKGRVVGAFSRVNDAWVAQRRLDGVLVGSGDSWASLARVTRRRPLTAFGGVETATLEPGSEIIERFVGDPDEIARLVAGRKISALKAWLPDPAADRLAALLDLEPAGSKVTSAGEVQGLWARDLTNLIIPPRLHKGLARLPVEIDPAPLLAEMARADVDWAPHYSSYNRRHSWWAVSLRGFGDERFIEKPAEMSRKWKEQHPGWETAECHDTPLRRRLPAVETYLAALGHPAVERVRLMALDPGGGELERHADSTEHDACLAFGRLCRLHAPLVTNPGVRFTSWGLDGEPRRAHLPAGSVWLLDHSKPHAAMNMGDARRLHLVIDAWVDAELGALLDAAA